MDKDQLCRRCFNTEVATVAGLDDFLHVEFEPVGLIDNEGKLHEFYFRTFLFGTGVALDAFELRDGNPAGYQFQVIAEPEKDILAATAPHRLTLYTGSAPEPVPGYRPA